MTTRKADALTGTLAADGDAARRTFDGPEQHTPPAGFCDRLLALREAIDKVQPLADHRGNFAAIHAMIVLGEAIRAVSNDIAFIVDDGRADLLAALTDLRAASEDAYKAGRIAAEPFVRAGNVIAQNGGPR